METITRFPVVGFKNLNELLSVSSGAFVQDIKRVEFNVSKKVFFLSSLHKIIIVRMFELNELMWFEFFILYSII